MYVSQRLQRYFRYFRRIIRYISKPRYSIGLFLARFNTVLTKYQILLYDTHTQYSMYVYVQIFCGRCLTAIVSLCSFQHRNFPQNFGEINVYRKQMLHDATSIHCNEISRGSVNRSHNHNFRA